MPNCVQFHLLLPDLQILKEAIGLTDLELLSDSPGHLRYHAQEPMQNLPSGRRALLPVLLLWLAHGGTLWRRAARGHSSNSVLEEQEGVHQFGRLLLAPGVPLPLHPLQLQSVSRVCLCRRAPRPRDASSGGDHLLFDRALDLHVPHGFCAEETLLQKKW